MPLEGACDPRSSVRVSSMGKFDAGARLKQLVRVFEGEAPVAYATGGGDVSPNN
jgi:hypothetical protein